MGISHFRTLFMLLLIMTAILSACADDPVAEIGNRSLLQVGSQVATVRDFYDALEIAKEAYPDFSQEGPSLALITGKRVLAQLTEQLLILERASELNLQISPGELQAAIDDIKSDFPEDTFEKTFLNQAIPYRAWAKSVKNRLLVSKVIQADLENQIKITPEDVSDYYQNSQREAAPEKNDTDETPLEEKIVRQLRLIKAQEAYEPWMESLKARYKTTINMEEWHKIQQNLPS